MIKLGITGAGGRMGRQIADSARDTADVEIVALLEKPGTTWIGQTIHQVKVTDCLDSIIEKIDVLIDFTTPEYTLQNVASCTRSGKALVIGTTGLDEKAERILDEAAETIPLLVSSNMSIGVNALKSMIQLAARTLSAYDVEIIEHHHRNKKDAPSGTAISLAKEIFAAREDESGFDRKVVYSRHGFGEREKGFVGIQAVRAGDIVGYHEVLFAGNDEVIKISHSAGSRRIFSMGALKAATFIYGKKPKRYTMTEVLGL